MFEVRVQGSFTATHRIRYPNGEWEAPHPHDWQVEVSYRKPRLDSTDIVVDFVEVQECLGRVLRQLEGCDLNDHGPLGLGHPTAERVAEWIFRRLSEGGPSAFFLHAVTLEEAPGCKAMYMRDEIVSDGSP